MALDLEIAGAVRELTPDEAGQSNQPRLLVRLRDSHHQVARLIAAGLRTQDVSRMTGYSISRLSWLQSQDPAFRELVEFYRQDRHDAEMDVEARLRMVALDAVQHFHETLTERPDEITPALALEASKVYLDRAGHAPVNRSISKNLNLNVGIGAKMDRAAEKDVA